MMTGETMLIGPATQTTRRFLTVLFLGALLPLSAGAKEPPASVPVVVSFHGDESKEFYLLDDKTVRLETCVGRLTFRLSDLREIEKIEGSDFFTIKTINNDFWRARISRRTISKLDRKLAKKIEDSEGGMRRLTVHKTTIRPPIAWRHSITALMKDGSSVHLDPANLTLGVKNECGKWELPIGSLHALKPEQPTGEENAWFIFVRFLAGEVEEFAVSSSRPRLDVSDLHDNDFTIEMENLDGFLQQCVTPSPRDQHPPEDASLSPTWISRDGEEHVEPLPSVVWNLRTDWGDIALPSRVLRSIRPANEDWSLAYVTTVFGEEYSGSIRPKSFRVRTADTKKWHVALRDQSELTFTSGTISPPPGWMIWTVEDGTTICGKIADEKGGLVSDDDTPFHPIDIASITRVADDRFIVETRNGERHFCTPVSRSVNLSLLVNGGVRTLPWARIRKAVTETTILDTAREQLTSDADDAIADLAVDEEISIARAESGDTPTPSGLLSVDAAFGVLELSADVVSEVYSDIDVGVSSVSTIHGDTLICPLIGKDLLAMLLPDATLEIPDEGTFTLELSGHEISPPGTACVLRLVSGDIIHAELNDEHFSIEKDRGARRQTELGVSSLQAMRRDKNGAFFFESTNETFSGNAVSEDISVRPLIADRSFDIPFEEIDSLLMGEVRDLPPPTSVVPGIKPASAGAVVLRGGAYIQGCSREGGLPDELPPHPVSISAFIMDACEVTRGQFAAFVNATEYKTRAEEKSSSKTWRNPGFAQRPDEPVVFISWYDAVAYCNRRSRQADLEPCYTFLDSLNVLADLSANGFRLPTEAEWEYAARGGDNDTLYPWGEEQGCRNPTNQSPVFLANYKQWRSRTTDEWVWTSPVKEFPPNSIGIYGMGGNVWEWCQDWYSQSAYPMLSGRTPHNPCIDSVSGERPRRVMRGGSFKNDLDLLRCSSRGSGLPHAFGHHVGFRCVRNAPEHTSVDPMKSE